MINSEKFGAPMRHFRPIVGAALLLLGTSVAAPAYAQAPSPKAGAQSAQKTARTVEGALRAYFSADTAAANAFRAAGLDYRRILIAHRLPSADRLIVEVELGNGPTALRYPLRLKDDSAAKDGSQWRVDWAPDDAYARALAEAAQNGRFAQAGAGRGWSEIQRLPAFPVLVGADFFVTPYGRIAVDPAAEGAEPSAGLDPPEDLGKHAQRWTGMLLQDDPGSANIDIILADGATWKRATQALLPAAMVGLVRAYYIGQDEGALVATSTVAPVFKQMVSGDATLVIGVSPTEKARRYGVRLRLGGQALAPAAEKSGECPESATFCASTDGDFAPQLQAQARQLKAANTTPAYVMLAASGDILAADMLHYLASARVVFELGAGKIVVGYIAPQP